VKGFILLPNGFFLTVFQPDFYNYKTLGQFTPFYRKPVVYRVD